ncbi:hypothetical protein F4860DRAFT_511797 [Xylaria cubensis]|nr:hypothetical protein F4860DRAFT_511797 [Xylaria cubensis]
MEDSPLFNIPLEVRQLIYEYYLSFTDWDFQDYKTWKTASDSELVSCGDLLNPIFIRQWKTYFDEPLSGIALPSLMLTCKRAYAELRCDVRSTAVFRIDHPMVDVRPFVSFAMYGTLHFERLRHLSIRIEMRYLYGSRWSIFFESIARRSCILEHLTMDCLVGSNCLYEPDSWETIENDERRFLQALDSITSLRSIWVYGKMPKSWERGLEQGMNGRDVAMRRFPYRWWREASP